MQIVRRHGIQHSHFSHPHVESYERQKGFRAIRHHIYGAHPSSRLPQFRLRGNQFEREFTKLFEGRIKSALTGQSINDSHLAIFPGHLVPAPGGETGTLENDGLENRGVLFFDQFKKLLQSGCIDIDTTRLRGQIDFYPVDVEGKGETPWSWNLIQHPALKFVAFEHSMQPAQGADLIARMVERVRLLLRSDDPVPILSYIRSCWTYSSDNPTYSESVLAQCRQWLAELQIVLLEESNADSLLSTLFEIEAYASYASSLAQLQVVGGGSFGGNWVEVAAVPICELRPSELCQRDRLFQELFNLPSRGFAPVVVNEKLCIADGNHRLTASWLWNLLCTLSNLEWDLGNREFQKGVADFIGANSIFPVTIHQMLTHLQSYLLNASSKQTLTRKLQPEVSPRQVLNVLPATLLPEYLSGAVVKDAYDRGIAIRRAEPALYDILHSTPHAVLPPRASYHFTDRALLPWFSLQSFSLRACNSSSSEDQST